MSFSRNVLCYQKSRKKLYQFWLLRGKSYVSILNKWHFQTVTCQQHLNLLIFQRERFPFDWRNPIGYMIAFAIEYLSFFCVVRVAVCLTTFIPGTFWILISITDDLKCDFNTVNELAKSEGSRLQITEKFYELISFQSDAKQLSIIRL